MKKNLKKLFALLLVVVMVAAMFAGCAGNTETPAEPTTPSDTTDTTTPTEDTTSTEEPAATETRENKVIYGSSTEISGDLGNAWWTNNASDKTIRDLINDYDTVIFDQFGQMVMNASTAESIEETSNDDGTITWTVKIKEGLTYNNGEPITAADYVAYALVQLSRPPRKPARPSLPIPSSAAPSTRTARPTCWPASVSSTSTPTPSRSRLTTPTTTMRTTTPPSLPCTCPCMPPLS